MEIKVNVETNAEEREDVELFEQERRKEEEQLYELADEYLSDFYDRNGIEELYEIDDAEYQRERKLSFFVCNNEVADNRT